MCGDGIHSKDERATVAQIVPILHADQMEKLVFWTNFRWKQPMLLKIP